MPLPSSGPISFSQINVELGRPVNTRLNLSDSLVRQLSGLLSGVVTITALRGKSAISSLAEFNLTAADDLGTTAGFYQSQYGSVSPTTVGGHPIGSCYVRTDRTNSYLVVGIYSGAGTGAWTAATKIVIGGVTITGTFTDLIDFKSNAVVGKNFVVTISTAQYDTIRANILNKTTVVKLLA